MAKPSGDKTEQPTQKRIDDARKKGNVARSAEVPAVLTFLGSIVMLMAIGAGLYQALQAELRASLQLDRMPEAFTIASAKDILLDASWFVVVQTGPILIVITVLGIIGHLSQVGVRFTPGALQPSPSKINPVQGAKRLFSRRSLGEFVKNMLKIIVIGAVAFFTVKAKWPDILALSGAEPDQIVAFTVALILSICFRVALLMVFIAIIDFVWQRKVYMREMRMTKDEVKQEMKQADMSPHVRSRIRASAMSMARSRMLTEVPEADVIITNPTHYACALRYQEGTDFAPRLIAKGQDLLAARIREIAAQHKIPIIENPPLARTLYSKVEVGREVPESLFAAVAEVIALVWRMQKKRSKVSSR